MSSTLVALTAFRFMPEVGKEAARFLYAKLCIEGAANIVIPQMLQERLFDERAEYIAETEAMELSEESANREDST
ncbi:MAG: hypothetical protein ACE5LU_06925 [Anaerolineae bacterium]